MPCLARVLVLSQDKAWSRDISKRLRKESELSFYGDVDFVPSESTARAMRDGPGAGLALVDGLMGELEGYHLVHAVRADLCRRLGRKEEAIASYEKALALPRQEPERRFLERRIAELSLL